MARAMGSFDRPPWCPAALAAAQSRGVDRFVAPSPDERAALRDAIASLVRGADGAVDAARAQARSARYVIEAVDEWPGAHVAREEEDARRGGGAFVIDARARAPHLFVQAPHTLYEAGTLALACALRTACGAAGLFIDTAHRYRAAPPDPDGTLHPADAAHNAASLFQAATEGILDAHGSPTVVQLHGFSEREGGVTAIVSAGTRAHDDPTVARVAAALTATLGGGVRRFPADTNELGATTNLQGVAVREAGGRFVHVELDATVRRALLADLPLRTRVLAALAGALDPPTSAETGPA